MKRKRANRTNTSWTCFRRALEVLYKQITENPQMKAYTKAEEDLNLLMNAVNMTISSYIGAEEYTSDAEADDEDGEGGCTHNCSTCRGCH